MKKNIPKQWNKENGRDVFIKENKEMAKKDFEIQLQFWIIIKKDRNILDFKSNKISQLFMPLSQLKFLSYF